MSDLNLNPRLLASLLPNGTEPVVCRNGLTGSGAVVVDVEDDVVTYLAGTSRERVVRLLARPREEFCAKYGTPDATYHPGATAAKLLADGAEAEEGAREWLTYLQSTIEQGEEQMSKITAKQTTESQSTSKVAPKVASKAAEKPVKGKPATAPEAKGKVSKAAVVKAADKAAAPAPKRVGRPGYGDKGYTVLKTENPGRDGTWTHVMAEAFISSETVAEANVKVANAGYEKHVDVAWAVRVGLIELAD